MTMTFDAFHTAVRDALRGTGHASFICNVQSHEAHPGRVKVDWWVSILETEPSIFLKGPDPYALLTILRRRVADLRDQNPGTNPLEEPPEVA